MDSKKDDIDSNTIVLDSLDWNSPNGANEIFISDFDTMITTIKPTPVPTITINNNGTYSTGIDTSLWDDLTINSTLKNNKLQINGDDADVLINGESLMATLRGIQDRLGMLRPNPALEKEWDELKAAGDRYRELEQQFKEKSKMWQTLKDMPPPEIE